MQPQLSIIIPAYNTEQYIERSILSAINQDIDPDKYEIIVVDDGSTDSSLAAARSLAEKHPNVKVITGPNGGCGIARNRGLDSAKGRYVAFLDSDDHFGENTLGELIRIMDRDRLDMLGFSTNAVYEDGRVMDNEYYDFLETMPQQVMTGREYFCMTKYYIMVYMYIYRRSFIDNNMLRMMPIVHEDEEFTPRALYLAERVRFLPRRIHHYFQRNGSIVHNYDPAYLMDELLGMKSLVDFAASNVMHGDAEAVAALNDYVRRHTYHGIRRSIKENMGNELTLLRRCRKLGLEPFLIPMKGFKRILFHVNMPMFLLYCKARKKFG